MPSGVDARIASAAVARDSGRSVRPLSRGSAILLAGTAAVALVTAAPALAIVINNTFDPNSPPVVTNQFTNTLSINGGGCTGTLISPTLVLTAAHCFFNSAGRYTGQNVNVSFGAGDPGQNAAAVIANPGFNPRGSNNARGGTNYANDIAIVVLSRDINNVPPVNLQLAPNVVAAGTPTYIVGFGGSGTAGGPRPLANDDRRRVAQTLIGNYGPLNQLPAGVLNSNSPQNAYAAQFRDPNNPNAFNLYGLQANPPAQQGGTAPGDSGGPLFYCPIGNNALANCAMNQLVQIGVQIGGDQPTLGGGNVDFGYGDISAWTPTALFAGFINGNGFAGSAIIPNAGNFFWTDPNAWVGGERPGNLDVAWLQNAGTITLDVDPTVGALWVTGEGSQFSIPAQRTMTATTNTILENGILTVNGTLNSPLVGIAGGTLRGMGTITAPGGTLVSNVGGTVAPGTANAVGTLTIQGDYFQGPGGTLQVRLAGSGSDRLAVTGQADLDGTLTLLRAGGTYVAGTSYTVLSAGNRLNTFATAAPLQLTWDLAATAVYTATGVNVNVIRTASYESVARTPTEQAIARALDAAGNTGLGSLLAAIDNGTAAQADADLDQLEGALVGNHLVANLAGARAVQAALDRHLTYLRDDTVGVVQRAAGVNDWTMSYASQSVGLSFAGGALPPQLTAAVADARASVPGVASRWEKSIMPDPRAYSAWMQGIGAWQTLRGDSDFPGLSQSVGGLIGGIDANPFAAVLPTLKSGVAFAYTHGNLSSGFDQGWTEAYRVALYAAQPLGAAFVEGHVGYSYDNMGTTRSIPFAGLAPAGSTHGNEFSATITSGFRQWFGQLLLEPAASIAYDYVNRAAYTETGAAGIGLAVNEASLDSLRFSVGGRALTNLEFAGGVLARPELRARYEYDALNPLPASSVAFAGVPLIPFTITGVQPARNAAVVGGGITVSKGAAVSVFADYNADLRSNETVQTALAGMRIRW